MSNLKLGQKVKCFGYLKKIPIKYVYANLTHFFNKSGDYTEEERNTIMEENKHILLLGDSCDEILQKNKEIRQANFEGIIVSKQLISTETRYYQASHSIHDPISLGYVEEEYLDDVVCKKTNYIDCYKVYYCLGKSRFVPIDLAELMEEKICNKTIK